MPVSLRVRIEGNKELNSLFERLSLRRHPEVIRKSFLKAGFKIEELSKKQYLSGPRPQKLDVVTGRLRSSIAAEWDPSGPAVDVGTDVIYGPAHEFGYKPRNLPARPFIAPPAETVVQELPEMIVREWRRVAGV